MTLPISVIILTFNEELNLEAAIESVRGWAQEVFVVDSYSTDRTVDIALRYAESGVHVVQHRFEGYADQWNWALTHLPLNSEWTLKLDADERVTESFKIEAAEFVRSADRRIDGVLFKRQLVFFGRRLRFGGTATNFDLRMWRTNRARFEDRIVNEHALVSGEVAYFRSCVDHDDQKSFSEWLDRHNRYSSMEAIELSRGNITGGITPRLFGSPVERRIWLRRAYYHVPARHLIYFLYRYLLKLGILDGRAGFRYAFLHASVLYWINLKRIELHRGIRPKVIWPARGVPDPRLSSEVPDRSLPELEAERNPAGSSK